MIIRRKSRKLYLKDVAVGGGSVISVQSMTQCAAEDTENVTNEIDGLRDAGADIVRVAVNTFEAAEGFKKLCRLYKNYPLVADVHFDWRLALEAIKGGAAGLRLNPGNIAERRRLLRVIEEAKSAGTPIRVGVNGGSLPMDLIKLAEADRGAALVKAAMQHIDIFREVDFEDYKVSVKDTHPIVAIRAYRAIANMIEQPIHLGITEAGPRFSGGIKSGVGIGVLLYLGIGDTIRVSLSTSTLEEVKAGYQILGSLGIRKRGVNIISCPTCARAHFDVCKVASVLEEGLSEEGGSFDIAVMGCEVNGPGECSRSDLGLAGAGGGAVLYEGGVRGDQCWKMADMDANLLSWAKQKIEAIKIKREMDCNNDIGRER